MPFFYAAAAGKPCGGAPGQAMKCCEPVRPGGQDGNHKKVRQVSGIRTREGGRPQGCRMGGHRGVRERLKIDSSTVAMESARSYRATSVSMRRFTVLNLRRELTGDDPALGTAVEGGAQETEENTKKSAENAEGAAQQAATLQDWQSRLQGAGSNMTVRSSASETLANIRQTTVRYIFDILFNARRNRLNQWLQDKGIPTYGDGSQQNGSVSSAAPVQNLQQNVEAGAFTTNVKVLSYVNQTIQIEAEDTAFSTVGKVRTSDGREIDFNVNVGMSRRFQQSFQTNMQLGFSMCDPLVINLDTDMASLSDQTFYFDIDADGEEDEISQLGAGSGYLALDKNGDGRINDGSELFGTASGNGFADLAKYDEDGNGWIDENDAIWEKLKIWCKDENGNDVLYRLADKGVGAICLQNASTDFTLQGQTGRTNGAIRQSGVFLYENGNVGTVQHVDVAKYEAKA